VLLEEEKESFLETCPPKKENEKGGLGMSLQQQAVDYQHLVSEFRTLKTDFQQLQETVDTLHK